MFKLRKINIFKILHILKNVENLKTFRLKNIQIVQILKCSKVNCPYLKKNIQILEIFRFKMSKFIIFWILEMLKFKNLSFLKKHSYCE
jgi:hypothetical protein